MGTKQEETDQLVGKHMVSNRGLPSPYILENFVAGGAFGQIYSGVNENIDKKVAIKLERKDAPQRQLYLEFGFYMRLGRNCAYTPAIHYFGAIDNWNALVMDLLGPSLMKLFKM